MCDRLYGEDNHLPLRRSRFLFFVSYTPFLSPTISHDARKEFPGPQVLQYNLLPSHPRQVSALQDSDLNDQNLQRIQGYEADRIICFGMVRDKRHCFPFLSCFYPSGLFQLLVVADMLYGVAEKHPNTNQSHSRSAISMLR